MTEELARLFHMRVGSLGRLPFLGLHGPQRTEHKEGFRRKKTEMGFPKIRGIVLGLTTTIRIEVCMETTMFLRLKACVVLSMFCGNLMRPP